MCSTILFITNKTRAYERSPWNKNGLSELGLKVISILVIKNMGEFKEI
jgi:hypothetical protein